MTGSVCRRFGPGRLPYASRHDVGGGIAMAATALLAICLWYVFAALLLVTGIVDLLAARDLLSFAVVAGFLFVPATLPVAFVTGTLVWRYVRPTRDGPLVGALRGGATAVISLCGGALGFGLFFTASSVAAGHSAVGVDVVLELLALSWLALLFAAGFAGWVTLPVGVFGGWYHERAKRS